MNAVKDALKGSDISAIKSASEKLNEAWQAVSAELYKQAQAQGGPGAGPGSGGQRPGAGGPSTESTGGARPGGTEEGPIIDAEVVDENKR